MFKIVSTPRAWWPVAFKLPGEDGELVAHEFELRFRLLKVDAAIAFIGKAAAAQAQLLDRVGDATDAAEAAGRVGADALLDQFCALVEEIAEDWRGVQGENGEPLTWNRPNLRLLLNEAGMFDRINQAFRDCLSGREKIRTGN